jgi:hypothetical protein
LLGKWEDFRIELKKAVHLRLGAAVKPVWSAPSMGSMRNLPMISAIDFTVGMRYYSVSIQDMIGQSRVREILLPRQIAMYLGKKHHQMSYVRLGEVFSGRDHTTVMNALTKIEEKLHNDPQLLREVRAVEQEVGLV